MTTHNTGTREEWLAARIELLQAGKDLTRRSDELARQRQGLPWVKVEKDYRFETDEGSVSLADRFRGRSQLLVYHYMFGPVSGIGISIASATMLRTSLVGLCVASPLYLAFLRLCRLIARTFG